jgi:ATP-binding cassette subfamily F protein uup
LAKILIDEPDVLILDEPTNHLDLEMITRLEEYLTKPSLTLLMVTHDRYFLGRVCNEIIELDRGKLYTYSGNYTYYLYKKSERMQKEHKDMHNLKQLYNRELTRAKKAPRARETKSVKRQKDFFELQDQFQDKKADYKQLGKKIEIASVDKSEQRVL